MSEELGSLTTIQELSDDYRSWKYVITYYEDNTEIAYWEVDKNKDWVKQSSFDITAGFDLQLFEAAVKYLREWKDR